MDLNFQGDFQADQGLQGDFSDGSQMPSLPTDSDVDWPMWMDMDAMNAMDMEHGLGMMGDWRAERVIHHLNQRTQTHVRGITCQELSPGTQYDYEAEQIKYNLGSCNAPTVRPESMNNDDHGPSPMFSARVQDGNEDLALQVDRNTQPGIANKTLKGKRPKKSKARIPCPHPGCKLTFPRNYELQRHQDGVHNPKVAILCSVYECDRVVKPFPRQDKFWEHVRKHQNKHQFVCIFENCRSGPWSRAELLSHLNSQHSREICSTDSEKIWLEFFEWRQTPLSDGSLLVESHDNCPLAFLCCEFKAENHYEFLEHLESHQLLDRAKGFEAIEKVTFINYAQGIATCPICQEQVCGQHDNLRDFASHLEHHSEEERAVHATELAEIFRPYISKKRAWDYSWLGPGPDFGRMIEAELQEAGVVPKMLG